jgi:hypothetical protein
MAGKEGSISAFDLHWELPESTGGLRECKKPYLDALFMFEIELSMARPGQGTRVGNV